ncbi:MAG: YIP1 family protein [Oscillospiraceae bacterium]|nr:YIP1 family protein [Oscillospiraceae bacterium]
MRFNLDMPAWKWPFYIMAHPFEGFEDLRWKKAYNMKVSIVIVALFFIISVCEQLMTGFLFNTHYVKIFNIVPIVIQTIVLFITWVIGNWALCTLFDGEGTMKNICVNTAYALVPMLIGKVINIVLSNCLLRTESAFITFVTYLSIVWSVILLISGMKTVHQYTIPKTLVFMFITIFAMVVIIILLVLLVSLFQQVYVFVYSIYTELLYRFSNLEPTTLILIFIGGIILIAAAVIAAYTAFEKYQLKKEMKKLKS